ncbi:hypothetical protein LTR66_006601 [Elasticomyces elasticus]|nr:hypothetical protein LTR66_006601 [Elasticomyces elasticus]
MFLEVIHEAPSADQFLPLSEHQAQTPGTFFGGKPVLHLHSPGAQLLIDKHSLESQPAFAALQRRGSENPAAGEHVNGDSVPVTNGVHSSEDDSKDNAEDVTIKGVDVWVTSEHLILFSPTTSSGVKISYPTISFHATATTKLILQLSLSDSNITADEDLETLHLSIVPAPLDAAAAASAAAAYAPAFDDAVFRDISSPSLRFLYEAISACADLHPDPAQSDGDGVDFDPPLELGAGGWITAENMHEFMDADGNLALPSGGPDTEGGGAGSTDGGDGGLGAGAGSRRTAEEFENAAGPDEDAEDETKWRRTG